MLMPHDFIALRIFGSVPEFDHQLELDERAKIARTRKNIELHEQELLQKALIEERQLSA
jgi:hypothetical protein